MASPALRENILTPANIVTLVRIVLIPLFVAVLVSPWPALTENLPLWGSLQPWIAAAVFVFISATDAVDGYLARSRNEVTDFGKFLDPLADKILVCAALLGLVELQLLRGSRSSSWHASLSSLVCACCLPARASSWRHRGTAR